MRPEKCQRCAKFYDAEKYRTCPFCSNGGVPVSPQYGTPVNANEEKHHFKFGKKQKETAPVQNNGQGNGFYEQNTLKKPVQNFGGMNAKPTPDDDYPTMMLDQTMGESPTMMLDQTMGDSPTVMLDMKDIPIGKPENKKHVTDEEDDYPTSALREIPTLKPEETSGLREQINQASNASDIGSASGKTVAYYDTPDNKEPVAGWLVCVKGSYVGESFELHSGKNHIGRSLNMTVALAKEKTVSREKHATITFDPVAKQFFLQAGDSSGLTYLNGKLLLVPDTLKKYDLITLGECSLIFVPLCGENFDWDKILSK